MLRRAGDAANGVAGVASDTASGVASQAASVTAASSSPAAAAAKDQGPGTIDAVLPLLRSGEGSAGRFVSVLTVTSVLAPLLEEVVFRGFLLVSLTKWLPTPGAVLFSSVIFGAAHFAEYDPFRTHPQTVAYEVSLGHRTESLDIWWPRFETDDVGLLQLQFRRVFYSNDSLVDRDEARQNIQHRRFTCARAA